MNSLHWNSDIALSYLSNLAHNVARMSQKCICLQFAFMRTAACLPPRRHAVLSPLSGPCYLEEYVYCKVQNFSNVHASRKLFERLHLAVSRCDHESDHVSTRQNFGTVTLSSFVSWLCIFTVQQYSCQADANLPKLLWSAVLDLRAFPTLLPLTFCQSPTEIFSTF